MQCFLLRCDSVAGLLHAAYHQLLGLGWQPLPCILAASGWQVIQSETHTCTKGQHADQCVGPGLRQVLQRAAPAHQTRRWSCGSAEARLSMCRVRHCILFDVFTLHELLLLQDALQLDGDAAGGGSVGEIDADGSDLDDLDDYINKLDAGVNLVLFEVPAKGLSVQALGIDMRCCQIMRKIAE
jgi:hypothetical protein